LGGHQINGLTTNRTSWRQRREVDHSLCSVSQSVDDLETQLTRAVLIVRARDVGLVVIMLEKWFAQRFEIIVLVYVGISNKLM